MSHLLADYKLMKNVLPIKNRAYLIKDRRNTLLGSIHLLKIYLNELYKQ